MPLTIIYLVAALSVSCTLRADPDKPIENGSYGLNPDGTADGGITSGQVTYTGADSTGRIFRCKHIFDFRAKAGLTVTSARMRYTSDVVAHSNSRQIPLWLAAKRSCD